ncbi:STAS domain-containing protein [Acidobacteriia bacterium AH_259_A11_L15]|nr:STAS domain-containing protein [Acidobacteriia bacterium AH_259_A11_L15]
MLEVKQRQAGSVIVMELSGRLAMGEGCATLANKLKSLIADGHLSLLLDCNQIHMIDSQGIEVLMQGFKAHESRGGKLKLLKVPPRMRDVLEITRLFPVFEVYEDEETALRSFSS